MAKNNIPENEQNSLIENEQNSLANEQTVTPDEITVSAMAQDKAPKKKQSFFKTRKFKYGSISTIMIALVVIVVIAANMLLSSLSDKFAWSIDLTSTNIYELSDATKEAVRSIDSDKKIEITVMCDKTLYPEYFSEQIKRFANLSDNITVKYIDTEKNPTALTKYDSTYNVQANSVVIETDKKIRSIHLSDYYNYVQETGVIEMSLEDKLTAGLLYVTNDMAPTIYFLKGHGESGYENLVRTFELQGAEIKEIDLLKEVPEFDDSSKIMVIANPLSDYSNDEIRVISDFLTNNNEFGRNLMYFSAPGAPELPALEAFLKEWNIEFNDDLVLEIEDMTYMQLPYQMAVVSTDEQVGNSGVVLNSTTTPGVIAPNSRSIKLLPTSGSRTTQALFTTSGESYSKSDIANLESLTKAEGDAKGPFDIAVMSMWTKYDSNVPTQSCVFAFGTTEILTTDYFFSQPNSQVFTRLMKIMVDETDDIINDAKKQKSSTFATVTSTQEDMFLYIAVLGLPVLIIVAGLVIYTRRRFL